MRRRRPEKREILPDPVYGDLIVAKFINNLMKQGKKSLAEKIFYQSIDKIKKQGKVDDGIELFKKALENVAPVLEVKSKRIGGATYQVPIEISEARRMALAMRWIIGYSKSRKGQTMADRLAAELLAAANNDGSAVKKKEDTHRMAEANKAFAHFR
ncbi:MAG TPA: 30S ribosomal protein S7 [Candidatus Marinimicrobia bacterium]|jgi:small subunit ribosomal protein S7|nr:30S ribosomal protein S7 [Candidatus Neomarinimicrobiota bacterium]MCS5640124.1 30S ribosomal protein S7 [Candidatus Neomarinimicrobiota bacterium]PCH60082.1 MAG: 30S ribosomal protein S7 [Candidatus Neomarinimicrobiota bacterium]HIB14367.1 30S ribosomal protein S7 [Candidatus Neomarinimicrobiota bacterium]HIG51408.1 30S ribosomal protein S7 [Candidatus Neomarinimicrobiota bacterium]|tara:strand:+ start:520 stop:987 length:468 start_codon:yes stop_codon:yes gene_type:complete